LLADFDLNNGIQAFMLKLENPHSILDAVESSGQLDDHIWSRLVSATGRLDVLASGRMNPGFRIEPAQVHAILDFARRHYRAACVDLSGNLEKYSIEILHEAKRIFLVVTAELPALHLARQKLNHLRSLELEGRVSIVLNRAQKRALLNEAEIEGLIGLPVELTCPNDYAGVHRALTAGRRIDPSSELGKCFRRIAEAALGQRSKSVAGRKRFVEYFSILPARYSAAPRL
jgi:Flp pilus assembly CpaE family ATPase